MKHFSFDWYDAPNDLIHVICDNDDIPAIRIANITPYELTIVCFPGVFDDVSEYSSLPGVKTITYDYSDSKGNVAFVISKENNPEAYADFVNIQMESLKSINDDLKESIEGLQMEVDSNEVDIQKLRKF